MAQTLDGFLISTVEQNGRYSGLELGKVWLKSPVARTNSWSWYSFPTLGLAREAAVVAASMSASTFEDWYDTGHPQTPLAHTRT